ncbi:MAG: pilus assembly protein PilP [Myxococcaceae bacterium]|nr:pilus assembly protein PilP [Myxococcaceae bacterium]
MKTGPFITAALCALALACDGSSSSPQPASAPRKPQAAAKPKAQTAATGTEIATTVQYSYNPISKRDPFRAPDEILLPSRLAGAGAVSGCNEPLCQWDLEQLKLVAVVTGDANPIAMVTDPQGVGYLVKRNSRIGKLGGRVTSILRDGITVTEYWTQPNGESKPIQKPLKLLNEKSGKPEMDLLSGKLVGEHFE